MVSFRGVNIYAVSQFDAKRLPEYSTAHSKKALSPIAVCLIPIYAGAQFWFEYAIDGPHPPGSAWFFKLFMNGHHVTSWDCAAKHEYRGKAAYSLRITRVHYNLFGARQQVVQDSFKFGATIEGSPKATDDCVEIRVYRTSKRRRIRQPQVDPAVAKQLQERDSGQSALR